MNFDEKYRKKTAEAAPPSSMDVLQAAASPVQEYKPFNAMAHPEFELWIRTNAANEFSDLYLPYSFRTYMMSDGNGFIVSMSFSIRIVSVILHGRNLQELVHKLSKREIEWVMEYDAEKWGEMPQDTELPYITRIEITREGMPSQRNEDAEPEGTTAPESTVQH